MPKTQLNCAIVGVGKSVSDCIRVINKFNTTSGTRRMEIRQILLDQQNYIPSGTDSYPVLSTKNINDPAVCDLLEKAKIDFLFSVNNHQIIKPALLGVAKQAVLNFHNAPLPKYGGVNSCAWAIFNGEVNHGVTWHIMEPGIDTGPILAQSRFPLAPNDTAISLIMKCITEGMSLFSDLLPTLFDGLPPSLAQDPAARTYYSRKDIPSEGIFDFRWSYVQADRYMRCVNVSPFPQQLPFGLANCGGRPFRLAKISRLSEAPRNTPGTVVEATGGKLVASIGDCDIRIDSLLIGDDRRLPVAHFIEIYKPTVGTSLQAAFDEAGKDEG